MNKKENYKFVEFTPRFSGRKYRGLNLSNGYILISTSLNELFKVGQRYKVLIDKEKSAIALQESEDHKDNVLRDLKTSFALSFSRAALEKSGIGRGRYLLEDTLNDNGPRMFIFKAVDSN